MLVVKRLVLVPVGAGGCGRIMRAVSVDMVLVVIVQMLVLERPSSPTTPAETITRGSCTFLKRSTMASVTLAWRSKSSPLH
jgi:hypothetical protein